MDNFLLILGLCILILTIWFVEYKEREYCENKWMVYTDSLFFNECLWKQ